MNDRAIGWLVGSVLAAAACGRSAPELADLPTTNEAGTAGDASSVGGSAGTSGVGGVGGVSGDGTGGGIIDEPCVPPRPLAGQRMVRLSFDQIAFALVPLIGAAATENIATLHELPTLENRSFPPLQSAREGTLVTDSVFLLGDAVAQAVGKYVFENFSVFTGCGVSPTDDCAQAFVLDFAERAFRRPLTQEEQANISNVYVTAKSLGGTVEQATQYGVYAVIESPRFLYRTEVGDTGASPQHATLTAYELASLLSFFLTNGPPDGELLDTAASGTLLREAALQSQIERLLELPATRINLETALLSYLGVYALPELAIDPSVADTRILHQGMRNSMVHEAELFLEDHLWNGNPTAELLVSQRSRVNSTLALAYGPEVQAAVDPNPDVFREVLLPSERAGLLTMPGFLTAHVRPAATAVTGRGLLVNALFACQNNPAYSHPPEDPLDPPPTEDHRTQREAAEHRAAQAVCAGCHVSFDGYGLALERFDSIGRFRTTDEAGRPIDPTVSIPIASEPVSGAPGLAEALAEPNVFSACLAETLLRLAFAEPTTDQTGRQCEARDIVARHAGGDTSFANLVREVALSPALVARSREAF